MREVKRVGVDREGPHKTRFRSAAARPGLNAAGDPEDDEEEEKKKPEEDEEDDDNDGEEEEVPWQVAGPYSEKARGLTRMALTSGKTPVWNRSEPIETCVFKAQSRCFRVLSYRT